MYRMRNAYGMFIMVRSIRKLSDNTGCWEGERIWSALYRYRFPILRGMKENM